MWVRDALPEDAGALADIFYRAVHDGAAPRYAPAQRAAWAPERGSAQAWAERVAGLETLVAEHDSVVGFMAMTPGGHVDLAFVDPDWRGRGVADRLYAVLEGRARAAGLPRLTTHASLMARGFFERHDWQVTAPQTITRNGVDLPRFEMAKSLA